MLLPLVLLSMLPEDVVREREEEGDGDVISEREVEEAAARCAAMHAWCSRSVRGQMLDDRQRCLVDHFEHCISLWICNHREVARFSHRVGDGTVGWQMLDAVRGFGECFGRVCMLMPSDNGAPSSTCMSKVPHNLHLLAR
jgi:hypothetical protein